MNIIICAHLRAGYNIVKNLNNRDGINLYVYTYNTADNQNLIDYCKKNNIKYSLDKINDCLDFIKNFKPDYLLSVYYRDIINQNILKSAKRTANLHPSLLPKYRGCFSAPWAIINDEKMTGITYHEMEQNVDVGKIWFQKKIELNKNDTAFGLYNKLVDMGIACFDDFWERFVNPNFNGYPQKVDGSFYYRKLPFNGKINLNWSAERIERFIRAMYFPPHDGAILEFDGHNYTFTSFDDFLTFVEIKNINLKLYCD